MYMSSDKFSNNQPTIHLEKNIMMHIYSISGKFIIPGFRLVFSMQKEIKVIAKNREDAVKDIIPLLEKMIIEQYPKLAPKRDFKTKKMGKKRFHLSTDFLLMNLRFADLRPMPLAA
jgi:hypothetical protein